MDCLSGGGQSFKWFVRPGCTSLSVVGLKPRSTCDPAARFIAPIATDQNNVNNWVVGGQYVWTSNAGWNTSCQPKTCSWTRDFSTGKGNVTTALSDANGAIYAAWVTNATPNPSPSFA